MQGTSQSTIDLGNVATPRLQPGQIEPLGTAAGTAGMQQGRELAAVGPAVRLSRAPKAAPGGSMISARKLEANRRNAQASTGPRTAAGKARAAQNAHRHGLSLAALCNPSCSGEVEALARAIAGADAGLERLGLARTIAGAQIDVVRARSARLALYPEVLEGDALARLVAIDRYERRAFSRRNAAIRVFDSATAMHADRACRARLGGILAERSQPAVAGSSAERSQQRQIDGSAERSQQGQVDGPNEASKDSPRPGRTKPTATGRRLGRTKPTATGPRLGRTKPSGTGRRVAKRSQQRNFGRTKPTGILIRVTH